ncbi:hypothetical protein L3X38_010824 [Prunus dulcis]|uniref:Uncharacterized protein n=1 Tax=Prunus dulcis TaxID=3755 RepID=A0AAD4WG98_PRUDU|nr:hypothetical protein L3X38_010824 [Prunus dulcis]
MVDATSSLQTWGIRERPTALARPKILDLIIQPKSHFLIAKVLHRCPKLNDCFLPISFVGSLLAEGLEERSTGGNLGNEIVDLKGKLSVSSIDFVGLGSAVKKEDRGLPAGNFDAVARKPEQTQGDNSDLYKPKVSSWGVFPRPNDISKTFGGGRVIRPGEVLETAEEKAAKEARTRRLVAAYTSKMGMNSDPKLRSECGNVLLGCKVDVEAYYLQAIIYMESMGFGCGWNYRCEPGYGLSSFHLISLLQLSSVLLLIYLIW